MTYHFYKLLDVPQSATQKEIKAAYYRLAKLYHPDVSEKKNAHEFLTVLNKAYTTLSNPASRRNYDIRLKATYGLIKFGNDLSNKFSKKSNADKDRERKVVFWRKAPTKKAQMAYHLFFFAGFMLGVLMFGLTAMFLYTAQGWEKSYAIFTAIPGYVCVTDGWNALKWQRLRIMALLRKKLGNKRTA